MVRWWHTETTRFYRLRSTSDNGFRFDILLNIGETFILSVRDTGFKNPRSLRIMFRFVMRINGLKRRRSKHSFPGVLETAAEQTGNIVADSVEEYYYYNYYIRPHDTKTIIIMCQLRRAI